MCKYNYVYIHVCGLDFFDVLRSSASELKLKSSKSVKGRKLDFVVLISKNLVS